MSEWLSKCEHAVKQAVDLGMETPETLASLHYLEVDTMLTYLSTLLLTLDGARLFALKHCGVALQKQTEAAKKAALLAFEATTSAGGSQPIDENMVCSIGEPLDNSVNR